MTDATGAFKTVGELNNLSNEVYKRLPTSDTREWLMREIARIRGALYAALEANPPLAEVEGWLHKEMAIEGIDEREKLAQVIGYEPLDDERSEFIPVTVTIRRR